MSTWKAAAPGSRVFGIYCMGFMVMIFLVGVVDAQDEREAAGMFQKHCAKCHGEDGRADTWRGFLTFARDLTDPDWQALVKDEHILEAIKDGPGLMPGFGERFSAGEMEALMRLVRDLKETPPRQDMQ